MYRRGIIQPTKTIWKVFTPLHDLLSHKSPLYHRWHTLSYAKLLHVGLLVLYVVGISFGVISFDTQKTYAAAITWDGGGSTNDWSEAANWSGDVVPTSADAVTFNSTSTKNATVDASFAGVVSSLTIASGYTGTISLSRSLQTTTSFSQAAGTFTAGSQTLDVDTTFSLSAGTFNASSNTVSVGGAFTVSGTPTFNANGGTFVFDTGAANITCGSPAVTFNFVSVAHSTGLKTALGACVLPVGNNPTIGSGTATFRLSGTSRLTGSGTLTFGTSSTLTIDATNSNPLSGFTGIVAGGIANSGTLDLSSYTTVDINGSFTLATSSNAVFTAPSGTMTVAGGLFVGLTTTFNANGGTVVIDGVSSVAVTCNGTVSFHLVQFNFSGGSTKTMNSGCTIPIGTDPTLTSTGTIALAGGVLSGSGTLTSNVSLSFNSGTGLLSGFSGFVANGVVVAGGTLDLSTYTLADINATLTISSGTFVAPTGTLNLGGSLTVSGTPTFTHSSGSIVFDNSGTTATLNCGNLTFNQVTFSNVGGYTVNSTCSLPLGNNPSIPNPMTLNGTLTGTGTLNRSTGNLLTLNSGATLTGFSGFISAGTVTIAGATIDFGDYSTVEFDGSLTMSSGSLKAPSGTMNVASTLTFSGTGAFDANGGTVNITGTGSVTITCNNVTFNLVTINHTGGTRTIPTGCTLPLGSSPTIASGVTMTGGTLSGSGTLTSGTLTLTSGSSPLSGFSGFVANSAIAINGATVNMGSYTTVDLNGAFIFSSGSFTAPSGTMTIAGALTVSGSPTFSANSGTIIFDGDTATLNCNSLTFNRVSINSTGTKTVSSNCTFPLGNNPTIGGVTLNGTLSGTGTLTYDTSSAFTISTGGTISGFSGFVSAGPLALAGGITLDLTDYTTVDLNNDLSLGSGTFKAPSGMMTLAGNLTLSLGTFTHDNGTVVLDGTNQTISGATTFYNLTKTTSGTDTLTFPASTTQTVANTLTLTGLSGDPLKLRSSIDGTQWSIDPQGTRAIQYVDVKDSNNSNTTAIALLADSVDSGHNTNWSFAAPTPTPSPSPTLNPTPASNSLSTPTPTTSANPTIPLLTLAKIGSVALTPYPTRFSYSARVLRPVFAGTGDVQSTVSVKANGKEVCKAETTDAGQWECRTATLKPGEYTILIQLTASDKRVVELPTFTLVAIQIEGNDTDVVQVANSEGEQSSPVSSEISPTPTPLSSSRPTSGPTATYKTTLKKLENGEIIIANLRAILIYENGKPVSRARVTLYSTPQTATTDKNGVVEFHNVPLGNHRLVYVSSDKTTTQVPLTVSAHSDAIVQARVGDVITVELHPTTIILPNIKNNFLWMLWPLSAIIIVVMGYVLMRRYFLRKASLYTMKNSPM